MPDVGMVCYHCYITASSTDQRFYLPRSTTFSVVISYPTTPRGSVSRRGAIAMLQDPTLSTLMLLLQSVTGDIADDQVKRAEDGLSLSSKLVPEMMGCR